MTRTRSAASTAVHSCERETKLTRFRKLDMNRPVTIWVTQAFLVLFGLLFLSVFLVNLIMLLSHWERQISVMRTVIGYFVILGFIILFGVAVWGLAKRAKYGRWLGVVSLVLIWALLILIQVKRPAGPSPYYSYANDAQLAGAILIGIVLHGLMLLLILRLSFSKKIGKFFANQDPNQRRQ